MKPVLPIVILLTIFRSGLLAQGGPDGFAMPFDKNAQEVSVIACAEDGFCVVTESKGRKQHRIALVHADTNMRTVWDTVMEVSRDLQVTHIFHEDGTLVVLCRLFQGARITGDMTVYLYHTAAHTLRTRAVTGLPAAEAPAGWRYYRENLMFTTKTKSSDRVWFLPAGGGGPVPFAFTRENPGRVLSLEVDSANGNAVIVFCSGDRTLYFETDFYGKSSFANIIGEPSTQARWIPVSRSHSVLMLFFQDNENFWMHPVNILNHRLMPSDTLFCADILTPHVELSAARTGRTVIIVPHNYVRIYPTHAGCCGDKIFCVTELYTPEYSNYFNGWYVEPRFDGYRYERADVHFFDTNGVFRTNVTFPYDVEAPLRTAVYNMLNVCALPNKDILLYSLDSRALSTMLLDGGLALKSPVSTVDIPVRGAAYGERYGTVPGAMRPWYGNRFLLTAYRVKPASLRKVGLSVRKMEYN